MQYLSNNENKVSIAERLKVYYVSSRQDVKKHEPGTRLLLVKRPTSWFGGISLFTQCMLDKKLIPNVCGSCTVEVEFEFTT